MIKTKKKKFTVDVIVRGPSKTGKFTLIKIIEEALWDNNIEYTRRNRLGRFTSEKLDRLHQRCMKVSRNTRVDLIEIRD